MTERDLDQRLHAWYRDVAGEAEAAPQALREQVVGIPLSAPTPLRPVGRNRFTILAVAAVLIVGGAVAAGSGVVRLTADPLPSGPPPASVQPSAATVTAPPSATPTAPLPRSGDLIAFTHGVQRVNPCRSGMSTCLSPRIWIVQTGGGEVRELVPGGTTGQVLLGWSPDGTRVLYTDDHRLFLADPAGREPEPIDTGCAPPSTTTPSVCQLDVQASVSNDGRHLVFLRYATDAEGSFGPSVVTTMDLETGRVTELTSTSGDSAWPSWSPDGTRVVFSRYGTKDDGGPVPPVAAGVFVVDGDGLNLRQLTPSSLESFDARWSPDGDRIVFVGAPSGSSSSEVGDVYTIRPDGTELRRLTPDGGAASPSWTPEGRILFSGRPDGNSEAGWWTIDTDGGDATLLVARSALDLAPDGLATTRPALQPLGGPALPSLPRSPEPPVAVGPAAPTPAPTPLPDLADGFTWTADLPVSDAAPIGATATLLEDGRVLVTAGCGTAAYLYDPATGTFGPTGAMTTVRAGGTATRLADGRVLYTGGYNCGRAGEDGIWATAELYDPATGTFAPTGAMHSPREFHTATLLSDGRVLIAGGLTGSQPAASAGVTLASVRTVDVDQVLATTELYDPATGTFTRGDPMGDPRMYHTATRLIDGRVLILGSGGESSPGTSRAEVYDPATGRFDATGSLHSVRRLHTATLLQDGRVLVVGGRAPNDAVLRTMELYDPGTGSFTSAGSMDQRRQAHTATLLPDGRVLIAGGYANSGARWRMLSSVELFDPRTQTLSPVGSMGPPRMDHVATSLLDGRVLILGGSNAYGDVTASVLYQP